MAEQLPDRDGGDHPVMTGLLALVGVALAVGLVLGAVVLVGTKLVGLGGGSGDGSADGVASMYLPSPVKTSDLDEPQITLATESPSGSGSPTQTSESPTASATPKREITLAASTTEVSPMEQFQLTGIYEKGEGAILRVERFEGGAWRQFEATGSVAGGSFQIPILTGHVGVNRFRVVDSDSGLESGEVRIRVTG